MTTNDILQDCSHYGEVLVAWAGAREVVRATAATAGHGPTTPDNARAFLQSTYALVRTRRPIPVYRFAETQGLPAPYGREHPSYEHGLIRGRRPAGKEGGWWSTLRPSLAIDALGYGSEHLQDVRGKLAVLKEWNRLDVCLEALLQPSSLVYVGRAASQVENRAFETRSGRTIRYGGGAIQFLLLRDASRLTPAKEHMIR